MDLKIFYNSKKQIRIYFMMIQEKWEFLKVYVATLDEVNKMSHTFILCTL